MNTQFFGREDELAQIQSLWEKIASGNVGDESVSNILVVTGSTGEGKTRLIQRFYEALANDPEWNPPSNAFWPSEFQGQDGVLRVNPDTSNHEPGGPPRFMWLGMRWQSAEVRNLEERRCPIPEARTVLRLHNDQIIKYQSVWEKLWATGKNKFMNQLKDGCIDTLLDYLPIGGFGFKTIGTFASTIYEANKSAKSRRENQTKVQLGDTEAFLDDLAEIYKRKVSIPLVLFLDDAQWIDESTVQFLDSFLKEIKKRKLPVLILITHWIAEWNQLKEQDDQSNLFSICQRNHATEMNLKRIDVAALKELLMTKLPGLTPVQQKLIIDKSCDNFLSLEENIGYLLDTPQNFVQEDISKELTDVGVAEISSWEDDRKKRIKTQFNKLEKETKRLLGWSSQIGERFLASVIGEVAKQEALASNLNVTFKKVEQRAYIAPVNAFFKEFRDRAIFQIAQHYFKTYDSRMEQVIAKSFKIYSDPLIQDSFDPVGSVKEDSWIEDLLSGNKKTKGLLDYNEIEKRDILGMMQKIHGQPNKESQSRKEYTQSTRIILLDFLNDCENDLFGRARNKAKIFETVDWSYLEEDGIGLDQRLKLSAKLNSIDAAASALKVLEELENDNNYLNELYLTDDSAKIEHDELKAKCLLNIGKPDQSLDTLLALCNFIEKSNDFADSSTLNEKYAEIAMEIARNELSLIRRIDISEMLTKASDNFTSIHVKKKERKNNRSRNPFADLINSIWCLKLRFEFDMEASNPCADCSALIEAIGKAKEIYMSGNKFAGLVELFEIYETGCRHYSINQFRKAAKQCWSRAYKTLRKIQSLPIVKSNSHKENQITLAIESDLMACKEHMHYYLLGENKHSFKRTVANYKILQEKYLDNPSLTNCEDLAFSALKIGNILYLKKGKHTKALSYLYEAYRLYEKLFINKNEISVFKNLMRIIGALGKCESSPPSARALGILENGIINLNTVVASIKESTSDFKHLFARLLYNAGWGLVCLKKHIVAKEYLSSSFEMLDEVETNIGMPDFIRNSRFSLMYLCVNEIYLGYEKESMDIYKKVINRMSEINQITGGEIMHYESATLNCLRSLIGIKSVRASFLDLVFWMQNKLVSAMLETSQKTFLTQLKIDILFSSYLLMKRNNDYYFHQDFILRLLSLSKELYENAAIIKIIIDEASDIIKKSAHFPEINQEIIADLFDMAKKGLVDNLDFDLYGLN